MTRLTQYLLTEDRMKPLEYDEAVKIINSNCTDIVKNYKKSKNYIYRGSQTMTNSEYQLTDPTKGRERKSKNTLNFYTLLIDNLSSWKSYPKRSHSIVCSTEPGKASGYGRLYVVLPYNKAKIGVCSDTDIWFSFKNLEGIGNSMMEFNEELKYFMHDTYIDFDIKTDMYGYDKDWKTLTKHFKKVEALLRKDPTKTTVHDTSPFMYNVFKQILQGNSFTEIFNKLMNPSKNEFKLYTPKNLKLPDDREVWVGNAPAILITNNRWEPLQNS